MDGERQQHGIRVIRLRYAGRCGCGERLAAGERAGYDDHHRAVVCLACLADRQAGRVSLADLAAEIPSVPGPGVAGGSARRIYQRRAAKDDEALAQRPGIARFAAKVFEPGGRQSTNAWRVGAEGEEAVAVALSKVSDSGACLVLHDRRIPGRRANIDHIVIGAAAVYVVDAKRYAGARIRVTRVGGLFSRRRDELRINGRRRDELMGGVERQVAVVSEVLGQNHPRVNVVPVLCFVDALFPLFEHNLARGRVKVVSRRGLAKLVVAPGPLLADDRLAVCRDLAASLPSMT